MVPHNQDDSPEVVDFISSYLEDLSRDCAKPIEDYLCRYPDHHAEIRRAHAELVAEFDSDVLAPRRSLEGGGVAEKTIGPYSIRKRLGSGGQGIVYLAEDSRLARRVALKVLHPTVLGSSSARERMRREAQLISQLDNPGLCSVYEASLDGDQPFIAMRYIEGDTLGEFIREARERRDDRIDAPRLCQPGNWIELTQTLRAFEQLARSLDVAHEAGVVHRDIKPGNVIATRDFALVLLDFGLARSTESEQPTLTLSGDRFGTPAYMSPEQLIEDSSVDRRTDVYSLGVTLFECLTLERPFKGTGIDGQRRAILEDRCADPLRFNEAISRELKLVLETAMERDLSLRYATASEFADELARICDREPIHARSPSLRYHANKFIQRNRRATAVLAGLIVALFVTLFSLNHAGETQQRFQRKSSAANMVLAARAAVNGHVLPARSRLEDAKWLGDSWESRFVRGLLESGEEVVSGLPTPVTQLLVSESGTRAAVLSRGELYSIDLESGEWGLVARDVHGARPELNALSADGGFIVSINNANELMMIDTSTRDVTWSLKPNGVPHGVAINRAGTLVAVSDHFTQEVLILDARTGDSIQSIKSTAAHSEMRFLHGGDELIGVAPTSVWHWKGGSEAEEIRSVNAVTSSSASPSGINLSRFKGEHFRCYDLEGNLQSSGFLMSGHHSLDASGMLLASTADRAVVVRDTQSNGGLGRLAGHRDRVVSCAFDGHGRLLSADRGGTVRRWDLSLGRPIVRITIPQVITGFVSDDRLVTCARAHYVTWRADEMLEERSDLSPQSEQLTCSALSSDGETIALGGLHIRSRVQDSEVLYRISATDAATGQVNGQWEFTHRPDSLAFNPSGDRLAVGFREIGVVLIDLEQRIVDPTDFGGGQVTCLAWSPDGLRIAAGFGSESIEPELKCFDSTTGDVLWSGSTSGIVNALEFSPDGSTLAVTEDSAVLRLLDSKSGADEHVLEGLESRIECLAFHPTERRLAAAGNSRLWILDVDLDKGHPEEVMTFEPEVGRALSLAFRNGGSSLTLVGSMGIVALESKRMDPRRAAQRESARRNRAAAFSKFENLPSVAEMNDVLEERFVRWAAFHEDVDWFNRNAWQVATREGLPEETYRLHERRLIRAVEVAPGRGRYWNTLGLLKLRLGQHEEAIQCLSKAEEINLDEDDSTDGTVTGHGLYNLLGLASAYARNGDVDDAVEALSLADSIAPRFLPKPESTSLREMAVRDISRARTSGE